MKTKSLQPEFVKFVPETIEEGVLYISIEYCTAIHLCVCGCGNKVVTPFSPLDWKMTFDGETVSFSPSIGNWSFDCQSHYWIVRNKIRQSGPWSRQKIETGRKADQTRKQKALTKAKLAHH